MSKESTLLIIDDDANVRQFARLALEGPNRKIVESPSLLDGFHLLQEVQPSIILLDLGLPGQFDGFSFLEAIRKNPLYHKVMVAIVTGWDAKEDIERARRLGADAYLVKPLSAATLRETVTRLEGQHAAFKVESH